MSWLTNINPFKKKESSPPSAAPTAPAIPETAGMMGAFYRKWKDPAFLKQLRTLAAYMQRDGVDVKDTKAVQAWVEKNKDGIEGGAFNEAPAAKPGATYVKTEPEVGRNEPCHCGSGKKFKKCHGK